MPLVKCSKCNTEKDINDFYIYRGKRVRICRKCKKEYNQDYVKKHYSNVCDNKRKKRIIRQYGISYYDLISIYEKQWHRCEICNKEIQIKGTGEYAIDHDHLTGKVRGILCTFCNNGLGLFKDSTEILINAIKYLNRNKT